MAYIHSHLFRGRIGLFDYACQQILDAGDGAAFGRADPGCRVAEAIKGCDIYGPAAHHSLIGDNNDQIHRSQWYHIPTGLLSGQIDNFMTHAILFWIVYSCFACHHGFISRSVRVNYAFPSSH